MNVSACIVTRGDVSLSPVTAKLPAEWERVVWDNGGPCVVTWYPEQEPKVEMLAGTDQSVFGRYMAVNHAAGELIYTQDDDCVVSDPAELVRVWLEEWEAGGRKNVGHLVANMPQEFRPHYTDNCLVGFGAVFHRDMPRSIFARFLARQPKAMYSDPWFYRTCDVVFTTLMPRRILVDVPKENLDYAYDENRMWRQASHVGERAKMRELALRCR